jgi:quinolinate synthase
MHIGLEADNPADGRPGCPRRPQFESRSIDRRFATMIRLQRPIPERYVSASPEELDRMIAVARAHLGNRLMILGHHYQRDEVMKWADARGDSLGLSRRAAACSEAEFIVFCGVHFMAESADILTADHQKVVLPDLNAGCSMADMADLDAVEEAWEAIGTVTDAEAVIPVTYMNSSAALKAFVGRKGGAVCTSSNASAVVSWALGLETGDASTRSQAGRPASPQGRQVLFFPDQHLGRNTAIALGFPRSSMSVWNPRLELGGLTEAEIKESTFLLWKGHCSVHQRFTPAHVADFRRRHPDGLVVVHPECSNEVVELADAVGSTDFIIRYVSTAPPGSVVGVGTEIHLVHRLAQEHPSVTVESLDPLVCPCSTMFRIDAPHLAWVLERLADGEVVNQITVPADVAADARIALDRMLAIA